MPTVEYSECQPWQKTNHDQQASCPWQGVSKTVPILQNPPPKKIGIGKSAVATLPMDQQTGRLINSFDFCQPIADVYCGQLINESARFL